MTGKTFVLEGRAPTKGSYVVAGSSVRNSNKRLREWTEAAQWAARGVGIKRLEAPAPVNVAIVFFLERPGLKSTRAGLEAPVIPPDVDKVARAILDALTGIAYADDAQVTKLVICKAWADRGHGPRVAVTVAAADGEGL